MGECTLRAVFLEYDHPEDFYKIVGQKSNRPSRILLVFRIFILLYSYAVSLWILCQLFLAPKLKIYIQYSFWVQILWASTADFGFMTSMRNPRSYIEEAFVFSLPWYLKVYWASFSATLPAVVLSFIIFWSQMWTATENVDILFIFLGNVTPFLTLLEFALVAFSLRIVHFFWFLLHGLFYIILSVAYHSAGGLGIDDTPYVYKNLDWRNPKYALLAVFIAISIGEAAYVIFWIISKLKLSKWCCGRSVAE